ncbi:MAG: hypothetical protein ABI625_19515 [bacterium]
MSAPEPVVPDQRKPSRVSVALVLFAALLIIPGLCFGLSDLEGQFSMGLLVLWLLVLVVWIGVLLVKLARFITRSRQRKSSE